MLIAEESLSSDSKRCIHFIPAHGTDSPPVFFMWVFPGDSNVLDNGYASLDTLFVIAPWVFLFLVPAITMRSFAEERRMGTIELLITKPLSSMQIIAAKYLAGLALVLFSLLPTLIYFVSIYLLGSPVGNIDVGGTWGSFIGLLFLGASFVAIGVFCSSLTDNQIISFIFSICLCFTFYTGFQTLSSLSVLSSLDSLIIGIGIQDHYLSMSRGVLDSRDVLYFLSLIGLFIWMTRTVLVRRSIL